MSLSPHYHPSPELLRQFSQGELLTGLSVAISAHLELCEQCRLETEKLTELASHDWLEKPASDAAPDDQMLAAIFEQPQQFKASAPAPVQHTIHLPQGSVTLPHVLARAANQNLRWKKLPGGINLAPLGLDSRTQCDFLYMKPGSQIPRHTHAGKEITLVLDGSFSDEAGHYQPGDFLMRTTKGPHAPVTETGCLCFTVLESPIIFTSGLARLLNPLNQRLFRRALKRNARR